MTAGPDVTATFCATLVDEWVRSGVAHAVISPGSRSTPLALALADAASRRRIKLHVHHDERSASFIALGIGLSTGRPAVLLCTSGTAAAHFHAAVIEAHQAAVPLVVCTADRPPELRDVGAPQTIDQNRLFTTSVRWYCDAGVPDDAMSSSWRSLASRAVADAIGPVPGPVHLNLPFREPLLGTPQALPAPRDIGPWHTSATSLSTDIDAALVSRFASRRGVIVAGEGTGDDVHDLAEHLAWPVLADPRSRARSERSTTIASFDALLRHPSFAADHRPEVVVRFGQPPASKVLDQWIAASGADLVVVNAMAGWSDPGRRASHVLHTTVSALVAACADVAGARNTPWLARWRNAESVAQSSLAHAFAHIDFPNEPAVARELMRAMPEGSVVVASSSMPIRDLEWFALPRQSVRVLSNRGANGIDGVVSTAVGVAVATGQRVALLIGDVAFLHDTNGLLGLRDRGADLLIVVVDNRGGGIFEFLPPARAVERERFETLFGTPHSVDLGALVRSHGIDVAEVGTVDELRKAIDAEGLSVALVRTDRRENVAVHDELNAAVATALDRGVR